MHSFHVSLSELHISQAWHRGGGESDLFVRTARKEEGCALLFPFHDSELVYSPRSSNRGMIKAVTQRHLIVLYLHVVIMFLSLLRLSMTNSLHEMFKM